LLSQLIFFLLLFFISSKEEEARWKQSFSSFSFRNRQFVKQPIMKRLVYCRLKEEEQQLKKCLLLFFF